MSNAKRQRLVDLAAAQTLAAAGYHGLAAALFQRHGVSYQSPAAKALAEIASADGVVLS